MRITLLIAASLLVAACSQSTGGEREPAKTTSPAPARSTSSESLPPSSHIVPPAPGTPISDVITWIEAGTPADPEGFHSVTRDGVVTQLSGDVAFTTSSDQGGMTTCMTKAGHGEGALACLVDLSDPPPRPSDGYGPWKGNWVDFDGMSVQVGSIHGDPGRFGDGDGAGLPNGDALSFGDYRCRADQIGLFCVNYAHRSAVRFSDAGIEPFGCLQSVSPPVDIGEKFSCEA